MSEQLPANLGLSEAELIEASKSREAFDQKEQTIPFLRVLQPLSPQVQDIPDAKPGMLCNVATGKLMQEAIVIPIVHEWNYSEWMPDRGGFIKSWGTDLEGWQQQCDRDQRTAFKPITKEGNVISIARHFYIYEVDMQTGDIEPCILPFTGTGMPRAKSWSSKITYAPKVKTSQGLIVPPFYFYSYKVTVDQIKKGTYTWYLPNITLNMDNGKPVSTLQFGKHIWDAAVAFEKSFKQGEIRAAVSDEENEGF